MGKLPELYRDTNILRTLESEQKEFWFVKEFNISDGIEKNNVFMGFEGVYTVAEYFLNGKKIGESKNMFISHRFLSVMFWKGQIFLRRTYIRQSNIPRILIFSHIMLRSRATTKVCMSGSFDENQKLKFEVKTVL